MLANHYFHASVIGQVGFQCFVNAGCRGNVVSGRTTPEECCLGSNGLSYSDDTKCFLCIGELCST